MKKTILILGIILLAGCVLFTGCPKKHDGMTIREGVLLISMDIGYPPMEYFGPDGITPMGFDVEMGKEIAERLGLKPEFINTDWDGIFDGVTTDRFDVIISSVTILPERLEKHNFSKPYIANALAMVVLKDAPVAAKTPEELENYNVAYQRATTSDAFMKRLVNRTGLSYNSFEYDQVIRCFDELRLKRVNVIITDALVAYDYIAAEDSPFEIVWIGSDEPDVFGICMRKGNDDLTYAINKVLEEMFYDGTMQRISYEIFGADLVSEARLAW